MSPTTATPWILEPHRAALELAGGWRAQIALDSPAHGCHLSSREVSFTALAAHAPLAAGADDFRPLESYPRGADLAVQYAQIDRAGVAPHVYWRALAAAPTWAPKPATGLELVASLQTDRLESLPESALTSQPPGELWQWSQAVGEFVSQHDPRFERRQTIAPRSGGLWLVRLSPAWSYAELTLAGGAVLEFEPSAPAARVTTRLFSGEHLEKGVIRRARAAALLIPAAADLAAAQQAFAAFLASPPPLTT